MMEPTTTILTALIAGAAAAVTQVASQAIKDAYNGLKQLVIHKLGGKADIGNAIQQVEGKPDSQSRQGVLKEELESAITADPAAAQDQELLTKAQELLKLLAAQGQPTSAAVQITQTGSGRLAYGPGAKAAGERGVVADTIHGPVSTGDHANQTKTETYIERQINTSGGTAVEGNVDTGGGDFVGRDKIVRGDEVRGNKSGANQQNDPVAQSPALQLLRASLSGLYDTEADARRIAQDAGLDTRHVNFSTKSVNFWHHVLVEAHKQHKVKAIVSSAVLEYPIQSEALRQAYGAYVSSS